MRQHSMRAVTKNRDIVVKAMSLEMVRLNSSVIKCVYCLVIRNIFFFVFFVLFD